MKKVILCSLLCLIVLTANAATFYVGSNSDSPNKQNGVHTLRSAIAEAQSGDEIRFSGNFTIVFGSSITINKALSIIGNGPNLTILDGGGTTRILEPTQSLTIKNISFKNGSSDYGGAIRSSSGSLSIEGCEFSNNSVSVAGGAVFYASSQATSFFCKNTSFIGNTSLLYAGGVMINTFNALPTVTFNQTTFRQNSTTGSGSSGGGGGLVIHGSTFLIHHSKFIANSSTHNGGGIRLGSNASGSISNTLIAENVAHGGGGIDLYYGDVQINNTTITHNTALFGGGISGTGYILAINSSLQIENSIVAENQASNHIDIQSPHNTFQTSIQGGSFIGISNGFTNPPVGTNIIGTSANPRSPYFANPNLEDYKLAPCSPAIGLGNNNLIPQDVLDIDNDGNISEAIGLDLALQTRTMWTQVDAGAYEFQQSQNAPFQVSISRNATGSGINYKIHALIANVSNGSGNYTYEWRENNQILSTTNTLTNPCSRRNYTLTVTDIVCGLTQTLSYNFRNPRNECADANPIDDPIKLPLQLKAFPNPSQGAIQVEMSRHKIISYAIHNSFGELIEVKELRTPTSHISLNLSKQQAGIYLIKVLDNEGQVWQEKIIIEQ